MSSQEVFWIAAAIGALFSLIFMMKSSQKEPTRLRLGGGAGKDAATDSRAPVPAPPRGSRNIRTPREHVSAATAEASASQAHIRSINVIFNYNGHSWDAFEVLGIPAGAPPKMVNEALERALRSTDPASHEFLRAAHQAILKR